MDTDTFLDYLDDNLLDTEALRRRSTSLHGWTDKGLPDNCPQVKSARIERVDATLNGWIQGTTASDELPWNDWMYQERYRFLSNLPDNTEAERLAELDAQWDINATGNNEVLFAWLEQAVRSQHTPAYDRLRTFLVNVGRRKFLTPIYKAMVETGQADLARDIYKRSPPQLPQRGDGNHGRLARLEAEHFHATHKKGTLHGCLFSCFGQSCWSGHRMMVTTPKTSFRKLSSSMLCTSMR